ncbi:MAG TPA: GFA family protein [Gaiellaceae bacterium]|nr:GFA family protein [Gaiellaceae bacterium]
MTSRQASCSCGQLRVTTEGEPVRISVCHCLSCQRRTGSAFGAQARFPVAHVTVQGRHTDHTRISDGGEERVFSFCPECGGTVFYKTEEAPDLVAVTLGAFADPAFPPPTVSVWEHRRHEWVDLPGVTDRHGGDD